MAIQIPIITSLEASGINAAKTAFSKFKSEVGNAEGAMNKFKAGSKVALDAVRANAATFAFAAGASIATFAFKAANKFQDVALEAGKFADATGLTVEEASRLAEVAQDIGIETGAIESGIGKMNKALGNSPELFEELGVQVAYAKDGTVDANETFLNVIDRLNGIKDPAERARVASELLGKGWQSMSELVAGGSDKLRKSLDSVSDAKVIDQKELDKARQFRDDMDKLKDSLEDFAIALGENLVPILGKAVDLLADVTGAVNKVINFKPAGDVLEKLTPGLKEQAEQLEDLYDGWTGYTEARLTAADQDRYVIEGLEDTKDALYELNIGWQRLLDTLDTQDAINEAREAVEELKTAAAEAFADPSKVAAYEEAVSNVIREIALLAETINLSNQDQNQLLVLVNTGQLERAVGLLAIIKTGSARGMNISVGQATQAMMENEAFLNALVGPIPRRAMGGPVSTGTYLVGERGPELLTLGSGQSGYVTPNSALGGSTINVTVTSADPNQVVAAIQQWTRNNGAIPLITTTNIRR